MTRIAKPITFPQPVPIQQIVLPLVSGLLKTKQTLTEFVFHSGLRALLALLDQDSVALAGPKEKHQKNRRGHHWGATNTAVALAGRKVTITRPRVRSVGGHELQLPTLAALRGGDPLAEAAVEKLLLGVSTRNYERSLERVPEAWAVRGARKSSVSRRLVAATGDQLTALLAAKLDKLDIAVILVDGIHLGDQVIVVALGVDAKGTKHLLGLWAGATENAAVCKALLENLLARGLKVTGRLLFVIDGGKGLRKAIRVVMGEDALVQRCLIHKKRNIIENLSKKRHAYFYSLWHEAWKSSSAQSIKRKLLALAKWLDKQGEYGAAGSLREGLDETLTVWGLGLPETLRRSLSTTNAIESLMSAIRRVVRRVTRWTGGAMALRWACAAASDAQKSWRKIRGFRDLRQLLSALRPDAALDAASKAA